MLSRKEESVMRVLFKLAGWVGKGYVYPTQSKLVKLCGKWCSVSMSRRTLNRVLGSLESSNYFERVRRHHRSLTGAMVFRSTLYKLKGRSFNWAYGLGRFAGRVFDVFRVPKMAQYRMSASASHLHPVDNSAGDGAPFGEGAARGAPIVLQFKTV